MLAYNAFRALRGIAMPRARALCTVVDVTRALNVPSDLGSSFVLPSPSTADIAESVPEIVPAPRELQDSVIETIRTEIALGRQSAFFVVDLDLVAVQHAKWQRHLPRIRPFYAIKCNPDREVVRTLHELGAGFDCASQAELAMAMAEGASPEKDIIFANPVKSVPHLQYARDQGVRLMTFDSVYEVDKVAQHYRDAELVIRLRVDDSQAEHKLSKKFGAPVSDVPALARRAAKRGVRIAGVAFHVGSGSRSVDAYAAAVVEARQAFDILQAEGHRPDLLDVGGGFPADDSCGVRFADIARALSTAVEQHFPSPDVKVMSEPGRYYVGSSHTLAVNVVGKRRLSSSTPILPAAGNVVEDKRGTSFMLFLSDGIYGSFNSLIFDHASVNVGLDLIDNARKPERLTVPTVVDRDAFKAAMAAGKPEHAIATPGSLDGPPASSAIAVPLDMGAVVSGSNKVHVMTASEEPSDEDFATPTTAADLASVQQDLGHESVTVSESGLVPSADTPHAVTHGSIVVMAQPDASAITPLVATILHMGSPDQDAAPAGQSEVASAAANPSSTDGSSVRRVTTTEDSDGEASASGRDPSCLYLTSLWGPTCDSFDCVLAETWLPELDVNDWLLFRNFGAYTSASSTAFNGFHPPPKVYIRSGIKSIK